MRYLCSKDFQQPMLYSERVTELECYMYTFNKYIYSIMRRVYDRWTTINIAFIFYVHILFFSYNNLLVFHIAVK